MSEYRLISLAGKHGEGKFAKVSLEDYEFALEHTYRCNVHGYAVYGIRRSGEYKGYSLHLQILGRMGLTRPTPKHLGDHIDRDKLNNSRENLRWVTRLENRWNCSITKSNSMGYIGVKEERRHGDSPTYYATISAEGYATTVGAFYDALEAALIRDALVRYYFGEFAVTNFSGTEKLSITQARERVRLAKNTSSKFYGVTWHKDRRKWAAQAKVGGKQKYLGLRESEIEAARLVDQVLIQQGLEPVNF